MNEIIIKIIKALPNGKPTTLNAYVRKEGIKSVT